MTIFYQYYASPVGNLRLLAKETGLIGIEFDEEQPTTSLSNFSQVNAANGQVFEIFCKTQEILDRYFQGDKLDFQHLDFLAPQGTDFQQLVWEILRKIPYGKTTSYGEIAQQLGKPNAMRAVGGAVGRNPISILIPCHRVLGKNQSLTGFGGGLPNKRFLLKLEGIDYADKGVEYVSPKNKKWER